MTSPTLIIGGGDSALSTAEELLAVGQSVILLNSKDHFDGAEPARIDRIVSDAQEVLRESHLVNCRGQAGAFDIFLTQHGRRVQRQVAHIIIAAESHRRSNLPLYGLKPNASVLSLSEFCSRRGGIADVTRDQTFVWINGVAEDNSPVIFEEMLRCAMQTRKAGNGRHCFLTVNLKVSGNGLEALQRQAKAEGILFFKLDSRADMRVGQNEDRTLLEFDDASTGEAFNLTPDWIVVDETVVPSDHIRHLVDVMRVHTGPSGFLQTENLHRQPVYTNRQGILAVGSARGVMTAAGAAMDAAAAAAVIRQPFSGNSAVQESAVIDTGACIRCLTCFRICPHVAVEKGDRMSVVPAACEACGLCVVECPRRAIDLELAGIDLKATDETVPAADSDSDIIVLGCRQSAVPALNAARDRNLPLPAKLSVVEVPCAGGVSLQLILDAFVKGAQGVMVMGCHTGNCRSEIGSDYCRRRTEMLARQLPALGVSDTRLTMRTIAANMAVDAARIVTEFAEAIKIGSSSN